MPSVAYTHLDDSSQQQLKKELFAHQDHKCYICGRELELTQPVDVDHILATDLGGLDNRNNWGLTHQACNRSKGNRDLDLQRFISRFHQAREAHIAGGQPEESFTLGVALSRSGGATQTTTGRIVTDPDGNSYFQTSWTAKNNNQLVKFLLTEDPNNKDVRSFVGLIPIERTFHDNEINPRSIVDLEAFIEEFYRKNPQLQPSLAHLSLDQEGHGKILIFDGQHKAAAQLFLGHKQIYVRVFVNADLKLLRRTNFGAHTKLAQIHFPTVIEDKVGYDIFRNAFESFRSKNEGVARVNEDSFFRELGKEDRDEMRKHFKGYLKFRVLSALGSESGGFLDYVEKVSARSKTKPLAYETVRKAFFDTFLFLHEAEVPLGDAVRLRDIERDNLVKLLQLFTVRALKGHFDFGLGIYKLEERLSTEQRILDPHLRAYRLCRSAPLIIVMRQFRDAIRQILSIKGRYEDPFYSRGAPLWADIKDDDWKTISRMLDMIVSHKVWTERLPDHVRYLQDPRQNVWEEILIRGRFAGAAASVYEPIESGSLVRHASAVS